MSTKAIVTYVIFAMARVETIVAVTRLNNSMDTPGHSAAWSRAVGRSLS